MSAAVRSMHSLQVPDPRLDHRTSFHPSPQALGVPPAVALVDMDLNRSGISMPAVAHVHKGMIGITGKPFYLLQSILFKAQQSPTGTRKNWVYTHKVSSDNPDCKIFPSINNLMTDPAHKKSLNF